MVDIVSSNILSCPEMEVERETGKQICTDNATSENKTVMECENPAINCTCIAETAMYKTPCGAFSDGFNYTVSVLAVLFSVMLLAVLAIKIMSFAGEDG